MISFGLLLAIYSLVVLFYILFIYLALVFQRDKSYPFSKKSVSVIIPVYNEPSHSLKQCVFSIMKSEGKKQVILVDNNSKSEETIRTIMYIKKIYPNIIILHESKQGKKFAHAKGLKYAKGEIIVFVDSDTIIEKNAIVEIIKPFSDSKVGGVAGQIKIANKDDNFLTKSLSAMFWTAMNVYRKAGGNSVGFMQVISGALGAYRKNLLLKLEKDYLNQTFMGAPCTISDDTFLTIRIQTRFNMKVRYCESAVGYTFMPKKIMGFWRVLVRWRKGNLRETILIWKEKFWNAPFLFVDMQFNFILMNILVIFKIIFLINLIIHPSLGIFLLNLTYVLLTSTLYSSWMIIYDTKEVPYMMVYSLLYEFFYFLTVIPAWLQIRKQASWVTR